MLVPSRYDGSTVILQFDSTGNYYRALTGLCAINLSTYSTESINTNPAGVGS